MKIVKEMARLEPPLRNDVLTGVDVLQIVAKWLSTFVHVHENVNGYNVVWFRPLQGVIPSVVD